jgi:hypothetical protein
MQTDAKGQLVALLKEAAEAHHVYETDVLKQADNDWAEWYAEYLMQHGAANFLNEPLAIDQVAARLIDCANTYSAEKPATGTWQEFYAERLVS